MAYVKCPFCGEDDFDFYGLQMHLNKGWCEAESTSGNTRLPQPEGRQESETERKQRVFEETDRQFDEDMMPGGFS